MLIIQIWIQPCMIEKQSSSLQWDSWRTFNNSKLNVKTFWKAEILRKFLELKIWKKFIFPVDFYSYVYHFQFLENKILVCSMNR